MSTAKTTSPTGFLAEAHAHSLDCVHCGLCLPHCPTYRVSGRETSSPRGRIHLVRAVAEGRVPAEGVLLEEAFLCLGCRACETACPSGVAFGALLEETRTALTEAGLRRGFAPRLERLLLRGLVARRGRLRLAVDLLRGAQALRLDRVAAALSIGRLRDALGLLPAVPRRSERAPLPEHVAAQGTPRGRVALLTGCVAAELFAPVNAATVRVLARNGFEVRVPREQGCCGALHAHGGDAAFARRLARHNLAVFAAAGAELLVTNSAGCGAALRDAARWLPGEAEGFSRSVRDVCELLDDAGLAAAPGRLPLRVCYDDPCHLVHGQRIEAAPRRLLTQIPGLELIPHDDPTSCCGAAGIYNLTHPAMSHSVLERKMRSLAAADPDVIATGNPGCLMQLRAGVRAAGLRARVVHPIELLDEAYVQLAGRS